MKKFLLVPDSFKGTLSSKQICEIVKAKIYEHYPDAEVVSVPVADGGEGSVDCFLTAMQGELIQCKTVNPFFEEMEGFYGLINNGKTAVIEMAACAGLPLVEDRKNPMLTTTYGVGLLIKDAVSRGVEEIILGLGGSATNDFGCGAASALGVDFYNEKGKFVPTGGTLCEVVRIDPTHILPQLQRVKMTLMCDVKNPVFGESGAAYVYAPQKGADEETVKRLDDGLRHICKTVTRELGVDVSTLSGGGAAGAMAGGMVALFGAETKMGIEVVLDTVGFDGLLTDADVVFTGEGKIDRQSLEGKVICGVAERAAAKNVPVVAIVGGVDGDISKAYRMGLSAVFTINQMPEDFSVSRHTSAENLAATVDNILRILKI